MMAGQPAYTQVVTVSGTEVRRLAGPDFMIEIEAIAFVDN
jgi:hypothetical protein